MTIAATRPLALTASSTCGHACTSTSVVTPPRGRDARRCGRGCAVRPRAHAAIGGRRDAEDAGGQRLGRWRRIAAPGRLADGGAGAVSGCVGCWRRRTAAAGRARGRPAGPTPVPAATASACATRRPVRLRPGPCCLAWSVATATAGVRNGPSDRATPPRRVRPRPGTTGARGATTVRSTMDIACSGRGDAPGRGERPRLPPAFPAGRGPTARRSRRRAAAPGRT